MRNPKICVLGAGIVGLTTATQLQIQIPNAQVTIIADKFLSSTTSDGAAGIFRPGTSFAGPNNNITRKWLEDSYSFYLNEIKRFSSKVAKEIGIEKKKVCMMSTKSKEALRNSYLEDLLDDYHFLTEEEVKERFGKDSKLFAATYTTLLVECRKYLPHLMKSFVSRGGSIVKRSLKSFEELAEDFDLVFNCSGLGAEKLCEDHSLIPVRGQVYKVYAPWIKEALYLDSDTYIIPGVDGAVTLGGTRQFESTREEIDKHDSAGIWERCTQVDIYKILITKKSLQSYNQKQYMREYYNWKIERGKAGLSLKGQIFLLPYQY
ncbi:D-amino-acid oxidase [Armadillidium vulgare]|nr:D-amino-acid oxidase [Armadillidium vulgare]